MFCPKSVVCFSILCTFLLFFTSCNKNNPIVNEPAVIKVEGKLVDVLGNPMVNKEVKTGDTAALTDAYGGFVFDNVEVPYEIAVNDYTLGTKYLFKDISVPEPVLLLGNSDGTQRTAIIHVTYPQDNTLKGKIIFTNHSDINSYAFANPENTYIAVRMHYYQNVTGTLIVLRYTMWDGKISDFKQFGYKENISIEPDNTYNISFTQADLSFNPEEEIITGNINSTQPPEYTNTFNFLSFSDYQYPEYISNFALEYSMGNVNNFSYKFPVNLPIANKRTIGSVSNLIPNKWFFKNVNNQTGTITINSPQASSLISPENNATGINYNSVFKFSSTGEDCIYEIRIGNYIIYTDKLEFTFGDLERLGFNFNKSEMLKWSVNSIGNYGTMNDFVNHPRSEGSSVPSETRTFTTTGN